MLFRQAGIFHTDYASDRALFPIAADRYMIGMLLLLALAAPLYLNSLYLSSYLLPWLVWTAGALGLNLILGWAGQFHLGYAAVMGIGAYAAVHATRFGIPWEIAIILAGSTAAIIGSGFAFAALRVKVCTWRSLPSPCSLSWTGRSLTYPRSAAVLRPLYRRRMFDCWVGPSLRTPDYTTLHSSGASW